MKWLLTLSDKKIELDSFNNALQLFLKKISEYVWKHSCVNKESTEVSVFDSTFVPDSIGAFFNYLHDDRKITDDEIILESRLSMLCSYFGCDNPEDIKSNALKSINRSFNYHYKDDEIGYFIEIKIDYSPDEIVVNLKSDDGETYLHTNAFIMDDESKKYFFNSHQVCYTSSKKNDLGKTADLNILLERI